MFLFHKKKRIKSIQNKEVRKDSPEVIAAKEYLTKTHPTLLPREANSLIARPPFNYIGCSKKDSYTRYHFTEGSDTRTTYIVLSDDEREKIIAFFTDKMKERLSNYQGEFIYQDTLKGMFVGNNDTHRFFSDKYHAVAFMTDDGNIKFPPVLESEDLD